MECLACIVSSSLGVLLQVCILSVDAIIPSESQVNLQGVPCNFAPCDHFWLNKAVFSNYFLSVSVQSGHRSHVKKIALKNYYWLFNHKD